MCRSPTLEVRRCLSGGSLRRALRAADLSFRRDCLRGDRSWCLGLFGGAVFQSVVQPTATLRLQGARGGGKITADALRHSAATSTA